MVPNPTVKGAGSIKFPAMKKVKVLNKNSYDIFGIKDANISSFGMKQALKDRTLTNSPATLSIDCQLADANADKSRYGSHSGF